MSTNTNVCCLPITPGLITVIGDKCSVGSSAVLERLPYFFDTRRIALKSMRSKDGELQVSVAASCRFAVSWRISRMSILEERT